MQVPGNSPSSNSQFGNRYTRLRIKRLFTQFEQRQKEAKKQQLATPLVGKILPNQTEAVKKVTETHQKIAPLFTSTSSFLSDLEQKKPQEKIDLQQFQERKSLFDTPFLRLKSVNMQGQEVDSKFYVELKKFLNSEDPKLNDFLQNDLVVLNTKNGRVIGFRSFMYLESLMCELHDNGVARKDNSSQTTRMLIFKNPAFITEYLQSIKIALEKASEPITPNLCLQLGMAYWAQKQAHFLGDIHKPDEAKFNTRMEKLLEQRDDPRKLELEIKMFLAIKAYQNSAPAPNRTSSLSNASEIFCLPSFTEFAGEVSQNSDYSSEKIATIHERLLVMKSIYTDKLNSLGIEGDLMTRVIEVLSAPVDQSLNNITNGLKQKNTTEIDLAYQNAFGANFLPQNLDLALQFFQTIQNAKGIHTSEKPELPFANLELLKTTVFNQEAGEKLDEYLERLQRLDSMLSELLSSNLNRTNVEFDKYVQRLMGLSIVVKNQQDKLQEEKSFRDATAEDAPSRNKMKLFLGISLDQQIKDLVLQSISTEELTQKCAVISNSFKGIPVVSSTKTQVSTENTWLEEADHKALLPFRELAMDLLLYLDHGVFPQTNLTRPKSAISNQMARRMSGRNLHVPTSVSTKSDFVVSKFKEALQFSNVHNLKENYSLILADPLVQKLFERLGLDHKKDIQQFINQEIITQKTGELARLAEELEKKAPHSEPITVPLLVFNFLSTGVFQCRRDILDNEGSPSLRLDTRIKALDWLLKSYDEKVKTSTNELLWMKDTIKQFLFKANKTKSSQDRKIEHDKIFDSKTKENLEKLKTYLETMQSLLVETGWEAAGSQNILGIFLPVPNNVGLTFSALIMDFNTKFQAFAEQMTTAQMAVSNQSERVVVQTRYQEPRTTCAILDINTPIISNDMPYKKLGELNEIQKAKDSVKRDLWKICSSLTGMFLNPDDVASSLLADLDLHKTNSLFVDINNRPLLQLFDKQLQETVLGLIYNYHALSFIEKNITDENRPLIERYQTYGYADFKQRFDHRVHALVGGILLLNQQDEHDRFLASTKQELGIREFSNVLPGKIKQFIASAGAGKTVLVQRLKWYLANLGVQKTLLITPIPLGDVRKYSSQESSQSDGPNPLRWVSLQAFNADRSRFLEEYKDGLIICDEMDVKGPTRFDSYNEFKDELRAQNNYRVVEMSGTKNLAGLVLDLLESLRAEMEHEMDLVKNIEALAKKYPQLLSTDEQNQLDELNTKRSSQTDFEAIRSSQTDFEAIMDSEREKRDILNIPRFIEKLNGLNQQQLSPSSSQNDLSSMKQSRSRRVLPSAVSKAELEDQIKKLSEDAKRLDEEKKSLVDTQAAIREMLGQMTKFFCNLEMSIDSYQLNENRETHLNRFKTQFSEALEQTRKFREGQNDVTASIQNYYFTSTSGHENSLSIVEIIPQVQEILKSEEKICLEIKDDQGVTKYYLVERSTYEETTLDQMKADKKILRCCIYLFNQERGVDFDEDSNNAFVKYRSIVFPKNNNELSRALQMHGRTRLAAIDLKTHVYYPLENGSFPDNASHADKINQILRELLDKILQNVDTISTEYTIKKVDALFDEKIKTGFDEWIARQTEKYLRAESFSSEDTKSVIRLAMDEIRKSPKFAQALHSAKLEVANDVRDGKFEISSSDFEIEGLPREKSVFFAKTYWDEIYKRAWGNLEKDFLESVKAKKSPPPLQEDLNKVLYDLLSNDPHFSECSIDPVSGVKTILEKYAEEVQGTMLKRTKVIQSVKTKLLTKNFRKEYDNRAYRIYYEQFLDKEKEWVRKNRIPVTADSTLGLGVKTVDGVKQYVFEKRFINDVQKKAESELSNFLNELISPSNQGGDNKLILNLTPTLKSMFADSLLDTLIKSLDQETKPEEKITIDDVLESQASKKGPNLPAQRHNPSQSVLANRVMTHPNLSESASQAPEQFSKSNTFQSYIDMCDVYPYFLSQELSKVLSTSLIEKLNSGEKVLNERILDFQNSLLSNLRALMHVVVNEKELQEGKKRWEEKLKKPSQDGASTQDKLMSNGTVLIQRLANKFCSTSGGPNEIYTALTEGRSVREEI